ncbi:MAG: nucleoside triphosphate pyrophosphohydrolase, partial [Oscillospiraceae bacterium]|nr:nucleoside triphosphate pyrophosphohydrolase [Oscillospiraceae bacterium]
VSGALDKLEEEVRELRKAVEAGENQLEELGDLLLAACDVAAMLELDPEQALHAACEKFIRRFSRVEALADGKDLAAKAETELIKLWNLAKAQN